MKKILCPDCGEVEEYCMTYTERKYLLFDADDEPVGATDGFGLYFGKVRKCLCGRKVKIVEEEDER